jgi:hypothetical protein
VSIVDKANIFAGTFLFSQEASVSLEHVPPVGPAPLSRESELPAIVGSQPPGRRLRRVWQVLIALVLLLLITLGGVAYYLDQRFAGKIYPNIAIRGVSVGELSSAEARRLKGSMRLFLRNP